MTLYDFQADLLGRCYDAWREPNVYNVMPTMATGGGKTKVFCTAVRDFNRPTCVIAHRQELLAQASLALNREGIQHDIIAPQTVRSAIARAHHDTHGNSLIKRSAVVRVAGVDTFRNHDTSDRWFSQVGFVVQDEGHHVQRENKWGKSMGFFPNALGFFPTAHGLRGDGAGLGRGSTGLVDGLVVGAHARYLINRGFLTDYRLFCPSTDIDFSHVPVGASGDFSLPQLSAVTHASGTIVGDVVRKYLELAPGKLGVTFAVDISAAQKLAAAYNAAGVPAEVITAKTPVAIRAQLMRQFRARVLLQLVSVDCLGEGVDVPAIEVVSMVRKTASFQLFAQQFGRALRILVDQQYQANWGSYTDAERLALIAISQKPTAIVIDHVGNTIYHGLPDIPRTYSLERAEIRTRAQTGPEALRPCPECTRAYERYLSTCPYCGYYPEPRNRSAPLEVDGDIIELAPDVLARMRGDVARVDGPSEMHGTDVVANSVRKHHRERQAAQLTLRKIMDYWAVWRHHACGESVRDAQRRFFHQFGVDVLSAMALNKSDAAALEKRVKDDMYQRAGIVPELGFA